MKPRSAPENGALVPPSRSRIAGTDPAPMKTRRAVPTASANARWAVEKDSISDLLPAPGREAREPSPRFPRASSLGNDIRHCRTPFGERTTSHMACQALRRSRPGRGARSCGRTGILAHIGLLAGRLWRLELERQLGRDLRSVPLPTVDADRAAEGLDPVGEADEP